MGNQALGDQRAIGCADPHRACLQGICHADIVADRGTEGQHPTLGPDLSKSGRCDIPTVVVRVSADVRRTSWYPFSDGRM